MNAHTTRSSESRADAPKRTSHLLVMYRFENESKAVSISPSVHSQCLVSSQTVKRGLEDSWIGASPIQTSSSPSGEPKSCPSACASESRQNSALLVTKITRANLKAFMTVEKGKHAPCWVPARKPRSVVPLHGLTPHLLARQRVQPREAPTPTKLIAHSRSGQKDNCGERCVAVVMQAQNQDKIHNSRPSTRCSLRKTCQRFLSCLSEPHCEGSQECQTQRVWSEPLE